MELPEAEHAVIDSRKLRDYILSRTHPIGLFKAAYFASLGYRPENWRDLEAVPRHAALEGEAETGERAPFGQKYLIRSIFTAPSGRDAVVVSVWIEGPNRSNPSIRAKDSGRLEPLTG